MTEPNPDKPRRRPRYRGKNPRHFHEKYKEHQPHLYPDEAAKVAAAGRTPAGTHRPIMVREILEVLSPRPGEIAVDCTLGYGGHAQALLAAIGPGGRLLGIDADPIELSRTEARLRGLGFSEDTLIVRRMNYAGLTQLLAEFAPDGADLLLADLGLSSMQIDDPSRGFTFKVDGPLDMRMDPTRGRPATEILSRLDPAGLASLLAEYSDLSSRRRPCSCHSPGPLARADHHLQVARRRRARIHSEGLSNCVSLGRRHRAPGLSGTANRRERRARFVVGASPQPAVVPEAGWSSRHPFVSFRRRPPGESRLQNRSRGRQLRKDVLRGHPGYPSGTARQSTFFGRQIALRCSSRLMERA